MLRVAHPGSMLSVLGLLVVMPGCGSFGEAAAGSPPTVAALAPGAPAAQTQSPAPATSPTPPPVSPASTFSAVPEELPECNLEPGMIYEQLKQALGKPTHVDRESTRNGVHVYWGLITPAMPGTDAKYQVEAIFRGASIQRRRAIGIDVQCSFAGTLHGIRLGGSPSESGLKEGYSMGIGRDLGYLLEFEQENGEVTKLSAWKDGLRILPEGVTPW